MSEDLNKEIEELKKKIRELKDDANEGIKDYLELRDLADRYFVEKESWKHRYVDLKLSYSRLISQAKNFIDLVEKED